MTTALFGKQAVSGDKALLALVMRQPNATAAGAVERAGFALLESTDWPGLVASMGSQPPLLVLCDEEAAEAVPAEVASASLVVIVADSVSPGAADTIRLPVTSIEGALDGLCQVARRLSSAEARCRELESAHAGLVSGAAMMGRSPVMRRLQGTLSRAAEGDVTVLIEGARGTGKSLAARIIHCKSRRGGRPLVAIEGSAVSADVFVKAIDSARNTTLVIENIDQLPASQQATLVRLLKERPAVGASSPRVIVTTSAHLPELVARGQFREDLYYRLHAFPIVVPALRERVEDVPFLASLLLESYCAPTGRANVTFSPAALVLLESMQWPGNVTQLDQIVRRALWNAGGGFIDREHILALANAPAAPVGAPEAAGDRTARPALDEDSIRPFEEEEKDLLSRALQATKGNVRRAAQLLQIGRATLYRKIQQYQLRLQ
jgi:DNA-binding NtrC family response regulator